MHHRVVITGMGTVNPFGAGTKLLKQALLSGKSGTKYNKQLGFVVGAIDDSTVDFDRWNVGQKREMSRASQLALLAAEETLESANAMSVDQTETLVSIGSGVSDLESIHNAGTLIDKNEVRKLSPYFVPRILTNLPAGYVAMKYGMMGGAESCATACATGLHSIGTAFRSVRHGWAQRAIAGATEACVNPIALHGFDRMRALARGESSDISRPFDKGRNGFVLSEGVGLLYMERLEDALDRKATILAEVLGYGISSDCYHISSPHPSGIGARLSMTRCLKDGQTVTKDVEYINAHATSTPTGDVIESKAIQSLFVDNRHVAVSSFKGHFGHLLAAAGAVETIATVLTINSPSIVPTLHLEEKDEQVESNTITETQNWSSDRRISLVNSFGFGGTNASLLLSAYHD